MLEYHLWWPHNTICTQEHHDIEENNVICYVSANQIFHQMLVLCQLSWYQNGHNLSCFEHFPKISIKTQYINIIIPPLYKLWYSEKTIIQTQT